MIPIAFIVCAVWPTVQAGIGSLQGVMLKSGFVGFGYSTS